MNLNDYDWVLINHSGGKDSQGCTDATIALAQEQGFPLDRIVMVHADLGRCEWDGTHEKAKEHAEHYGLRFEVVRHKKHDLLSRVRERGSWPSPKQRWCTSDFKRGPIRTLMTRLANEAHGNARESKRNPSRLGRPVRILNVMGMRAEESANRSKLPVLKRCHANGRRSVDNWLPILGWSDRRIARHVREHSPVRPHFAYSLGMPRVSCPFCIMGTRDSLLIAGEHNPALLDAYCDVEQEIGHTFTQALPIVEVRAALDRGERGDPAKCKGCPFAA